MGLVCSGSDNSYPSRGQGHPGVQAKESLEAERDPVLLYPVCFCSSFLSSSVITGRLAFCVGNCSHSARLD